MTARSPRRAPGDMFPGMPDVLAKKPPKAGESEHEARTLDEAIGRSYEILDEALARFREAAGVFWLFSGGNDSVVVGHLLRGRYDAVLHVNTGTGIPDTTQHVREVADAWGDTLHVLQPRNRYEDLVMGRVIASTGPNAGVRPVWKGFPGPAGHKVMYRHLKDQPLMAFRNSVLGDQRRLPRAERRRIIYLGGMRWDETDRRFRNAEAIDPAGSIVWVSPLVHWTDAHMREYRARHRCQEQHDHAEHRLCTPDALPLNPVTEHLHMSGECLCGAYAKPGELDEVEFFYPEVAARLRALEAEAEAAGERRCRWGRKDPAGATDTAPAGRLCSSCVAPLPGQGDITDDWLTSGLITPEQHAELNQTATP
ncbi:phosphoadenosine phosphosulfate reductase family protein [Streptomyces sp. MP131-18]|uniref:phosphoadenosine phosphosulfate reductase family protein n=1 Tax=Streptomyces sp. MP131-18 TaxID=1857892 RepID=UPI0009D5B495|nr:phosphoadenosine phosphosulfate reductase family protein [Streptomyces sp. MP131-18]ONK09486.1 PUA domain (predicted RNA-binding domain) [Streptomyces sp. MP131-18]